MKRLVQYLLLACTPFALHTCATAGLLDGKEVSVTMKDGQPSVSVTFPVTK